MRWRRVPSGGACPWCQTVSGQLYKTASSADFGHDRCSCVAVPVRDGEKSALPDSMVPDEFTIGLDDSKMRNGRVVNGRFIEYDPDRVRQYHDPYVNGQLQNGRKVADPEFRVMGGGPASGKSSVIRSGDVQLPEGHVLSNADDAKDALPEYQAGVATKHPKSAAFVHEESSDMAKRLTSESLKSGYNTVLDGTGDGSVESLAAKITKAKDNGAKRIIGDYVTVDTDEAVRRAIARGEKSGRFVHESVIRQTHEAVSDTFRQAAERDLFDELRLFDNNGAAPRLIYERKGGVEQILDSDAYESFLMKGPQYRQISIS